MKTIKKDKKLPAGECSQRLVAMDDALFVIGGKWKLRIIQALHEDHRRFNDLQRALGKISAKVLSNELKELELNGFVRRKVYTGVPVIVEYELTSYSKTLNKVLAALSEWGMMHRAHIKKKF
jgi:DNA-binding HxlR family transcriptional regulator